MTSRALTPKIIAGVAAVSAGLIALPPMVAPVAHQHVQQRTVKLAAGIRMPNPDYYYYWDQLRVEVDAAHAAVPMDAAAEPAKSSADLAAAHASTPADLSAAAADIGVALTHILTESPTILLSLLP